MEEISQYISSQSEPNTAICLRLLEIAEREMQKHDDITAKLWHGHPVWFSYENPLFGFAVRKNGVQLLFWSGQSFDEAGLEAEGSFKAAQKYYVNVDEINEPDLIRWLQKSLEIQWDYKNIIKRKGQLIRL